MLLALFFLFPDFLDSVIFYNQQDQVASIIEVENEPTVPVIPPLDTVAYDKKLEEIANNPLPPPPETKVIKNAETGEEETVIIEKPAPTHLWPVKTVYPNAGAILPFNRIVAYYGNLYSTKMGVLGEYPEDEMMAKLAEEVKRWEEADPNTPVIPALHYIAVVAQGKSGEDGKYRFRMPDTEIDKVLTMAEKINAIVFLDLQVGFSNVETEIPLLEKYLKLPNVHLAIDPEFSMKGKYPPGKVVGTFDVSDINFASNYLANLVKENNLTPKILVVHRYTQNMMTNYQEINTMPEVQIVINMDGWGGKAKKINTYKQFVFKEPVQFTGFKLFYKNDVWEKGAVLFTPEELLKLNPRPVYIQYQ